jgi:hypothetical protein
MCFCKASDVGNGLLWAKTIEKRSLNKEGFIARQRTLCFGTLACYGDMRGEGSATSRRKDVNVRLRFPKKSRFPNREQRIGSAARCTQGEAQVDQVRGRRRRLSFWMLRCKAFWRQAEDSKRVLVCDVACVQLLQHLLVVGTCHWECVCRAEPGNVGG